MNGSQGKCGICSQAIAWLDVRVCPTRFHNNY